jgi:hypothetical protein
VQSRVSPTLNTYHMVACPLSCPHSAAYIIYPGQLVILRVCCTQTMRARGIATSELERNCPLQQTSSFTIRILRHRLQINPDFTVSMLTSVDPARSPTNADCYRRRWIGPPSSVGQPPSKVLFYMRSFLSRYLLILLITLRWVAGGRNTGIVS